MLGSYEQFLERPGSLSRECAGGLRLELLHLPRVRFVDTGPFVYRAVSGYAIHARFP